jgi:hypothetical protein
MLEMMRRSGEPHLSCDEAIARRDQRLSANISDGSLVIDYLLESGGIYDVSELAWL